MKLTFEGILKECNRITFEQGTREYGTHLKSKLAKLEIEYYKGLVDAKTYEQKQLEILKEINNISKQRFADAGGDATIEF